MSARRGNSKMSPVLITLFESKTLQNKFIMNEMNHHKNNPR